jgi:hypothetical protein
MAVNIPRISMIEQARLRRLKLPTYLRLDGSRYLLWLAVFIALMSLVVLAQTGVVATRGYAIAQLMNERALLLREHSQLQLRLSEAQSLDRIRARAEEMGMRPMTPDQVRYVVVPELLATDAIPTAADPSGEAPASPDYSSLR